MKLQINSMVVVLEVGKIYTVGRVVSDNDIVIPHPMVSRYHAALTIFPDYIVVEDLLSTNDTLVDGLSCRENGALKAIPGSTICFAVCHTRITA